MKTFGRSNNNNINNSQHMNHQNDINTDLKNSYLTCPHLKLKEVESGITIYSKLVQFHRFPYGRVHICLDCFKNDSRILQVNIDQHFDQTNHFIYMKVSRPCEIYCKLCGDYQFCSVFDVRTGRKRDALRIDDDLIKVEPNYKIPRTDSPSLNFRVAGNDIVPQSSSPAINGHSIARGLINMGATCFMNSVLQVLVHNPDFADCLQLQQHVQYCPIGNKKVSDGSTCIPCEFGHLSRDLRVASENDGPVAPASLLYSIWNLIDYIVGYAQQDAHEFLLAFLNGLECQMPIENFSYQGQSLDKLYAGTSESSLRCLSCGDISITKENFVDLSLSLESSAFNTDWVDLMDCLELFTVEENLGEPMMCENCGSKQLKSKQLQLIKSPELLIIHLKRFDFLKKRKITKQVLFPIDHMNISQFCSETGQSLDYTLHGLVSHEGTLNQGHYISYVKDADGWRKCDDDNISLVSDAEVQSANAYLLFYTRR